MALYAFICSECKAEVRRLLHYKAPRIGLKCPKCKDGVLVRDENPPSTMMTEVLDNGAMVRKVERLQNAEELNRERAKADPRNHRV